jgi:DinB superfamily
MNLKKLTVSAVGSILAAVLLLAFSTAGQSLTSADRESAVKYLEKTRDAVEASTKGLTDAQWTFKAAPEKWSVAQVVEHLALAEDLFFDTVSQKVMSSPAGAPGRDFKKTDAAVLANVPDRSHKRQAPEVLVPTGRWSPQEALNHFVRSRARTIQFLQDTPDLREHVLDGPTGAPLDGYEWILLAAAHSERHEKQLEEVKADPKFPKN